MKTRTQIIKYFILGLFFTTLGATITIIVKKINVFKISNELYIPDILSLISTILLTLYIGIILEKSKNNERISKDTIIEYYKEYGITLNEKVRGLYNKQELSIKEISSVYKIARTKLYKLNEFAKAKNLINIHSKLHTDIFNEVTKLWSICTDGRDITSLCNKEQIEINLIKVEILIDELIFEINNL
jgi:hypothetical protein